MSTASRLTTTPLTAPVVPYSKFTTSFCILGFVLLLQPYVKFVPHTHSCSLSDWRCYAVVQPVLEPHHRRWRCPYLFFFRPTCVSCWMFCCEFLLQYCRAESREQRAASLQLALMWLHTKSLCLSVHEMPGRLHPVVVLTFIKINRKETWDTLARHTLGHSIREHLLISHNTIGYTCKEHPLTVLPKFSDSRVALQSSMKTNYWGKEMYYFQSIHYVCIKSCVDMCTVVG